MDFKLIKNSRKDLSTVETILTNRGIKIEDIPSYLSANDDAILDRKLIDNLVEGVDLLLKHLNAGNKIFLQVDSDADGYTSSAFFLNYLYSINPEWLDLITYRLHEGKEHGVILREVIDKGYKLVVLIDAGSNQLKEHELMVQNGIDVLVIDHHECDEISDNALIINNQLSELYSNKALCGVAMVWKFCEEMDSRFGTVHADDYLDLVAIGLIADMMDMRVLETHYLTLCGLDNINNPLLKALIEKQAYSLKDELTRFGISFYVAPLINATIRVGTQEEKKVMFNSMLTWKAYEEVDSTKRGCKGEKEWLVTQAVRNCTNVHGRQRKMRQSGAEVLRAQIEHNKLYENQIMLVEAGDEIDKNLVGLVAMELAATYKKPVLLLKPYEVDGQIVYQGSGRNYDRGGLEDFKHFLNESGMFTYAEGHASAFGAGIPKDKISDFITYANTALANISYDPSYEVDFIFDGSDVDTQVIADIASMRSLWGKGIDEPYVAIKGLSLPASRVQLLSPDKKPTIKITLPNGLSMLKFFSSHEEYSRFAPTKDGYVSIDIVGKCSLNTFRGVCEPQLFIEDYQITDVINYCF